MLEVEELPAATEDRINIKITKGSRKRSLDANAYHWQLCGQIARVLKTSTEDVHYTLMLRYGTPLTDENDIPVIIAVNPQADPKRLNIYARLISSGELNHYMLIKQSRYYDTAEMSRLIEGTIDEAKELGIETLTPAELHQMGIGVEYGENAKTVNT